MPDTQPRRVEHLMPFPMFSTDLKLRLSALSWILQWRLNLLVSVVSVWSDRYVLGPLPGSLTVITVFTK